MRALAWAMPSPARAIDSPIHAICTYNPHVNTDTINITPDIRHNTDIVRGTGSTLSVLDTVGNPGSTYPPQHSDHNNRSEPNSPPCTYNSNSTLTAEFSRHLAVNDETDQEIINVHLQEENVAQATSQLNENIDASEHTNSIENTAVQIQVQNPDTASTDGDINSNSHDFVTTTDAFPGVQDAPHQCDEYTALQAMIVSAKDTDNEVDIPNYNDPGSNQLLSTSRHESISIATSNATDDGPYQAIQSQDIDFNKDIQSEIQLSTDTLPPVANLSTEHTPDVDEHQDILSDFQITDDKTPDTNLNTDGSQDLSHDSPPIPTTPHILHSDSQDLDIANVCSVSDNIFIERSQETGTPTPLQVPLPPVSDLPGFEGLDQEGQPPPAIPVTVNAITPPFDIPTDSLYVIGSINDQPSPMLVDTGASITAVSSSFFSTFSPLPPLEPSTLTSIRTVSGEELPVQGTVTLNFLFGDVTYPYEVLVIDSLTYPIVLGRDFLMHYGSIIDMQLNTLVLSGNAPIPLNRSFCLSATTPTSSDLVTVHAFATYILAPNSESVIPVYPKTALNIGSTGLIEPSPKLAERYQVCGASQLVSLSEHNTFPFRVLNPTNKPVTIYRCSTMGTYLPSAASLSVIATADDSAPPSSPTEPPQAVPLDLTDTDLTDAQQTQLRSLVAEYRDIFALSPEELGRTGLVKHRIDTGDHQPIRQRPYRVSDTQRGIIEEHVTDMLNRGIIQPSVSPWASPIMLVKKKDGTDRFVVDFRRLNSVTRKDSYPLPRIDDALDALNGTKYFSTMDLLSGYWQVEMSPESREHTAFITYGGLYEFLVVPFGLTNAPSTYERLMECVLRNLTYKICLIYLDDILVYSKTFEEHLSHLRQVFDRLRHANLRLKPSKCKFACTKVNYLGHVVSPEGIAPDDDKISTVKDFPRPHNFKTVRSFLGLANYYRRFVKDFAKIAAPLNQLLRKDHKFDWTEACEQAFIALKHALTSAPILAFPDFKEPFHLFTDASNEGIGATLGQIQNGHEVAIAYAGRDLNNAERNYSTTEREALGLIFGIRKFEPYLHGRKFILHTDHHSLKWLMSISDPSGRLARWSLLVQQHDFEI